MHLAIHLIAICAAWGGWFLFFLNLLKQSAMPRSVDGMTMGAVWDDTEQRWMPARTIANGGSDAA